MRARACRLICSLRAMAGRPLDSPPRGATVPSDQELVHLRTEARGAAQALGVKRSVVHRWLSRKLSESSGGFVSESSTIKPTVV